MTDKPNPKIIAVHPPRKCELCGEVAETRPYGPHGEEVCFPCGMKDEPAALRAFKRLVLDEREEN